MPTSSKLSIIRTYRSILAPLLGAVLLGATGCQNIDYQLPGHSDETRVSSITMESGMSQSALKTPARMPVPGGFWIGLVSESPDILAVETTTGAFASSKVTLHAQSPGTAVVHYVNRFAVRADATSAEEREHLRELSLTSFQVIVTPPHK